MGSPNKDGFAEVFSVSCPSAGHCAAGGENYGRRGRSATPSTGSRACWCATWSTCGRAIRQGHGHADARQGRPADPGRMERQGEAPRRAEPEGGRHRVHPVRVGCPWPLASFYDWCAHNNDIAELLTPGPDVARWEDEITCAILTGVSNSRSESLNRMAKLEARNAYGFRQPRQSAPPCPDCLHPRRSVITERLPGITSGDQPEHDLG